MFGSMSLGLEELSNMWTSPFYFVFQKVPTQLRECWTIESKQLYLNISCEISWLSFVAQCRTVAMVFGIALKFNGNEMQIEICHY